MVSSCISRSTPMLAALCLVASSFLCPGVSARTFDNNGSQCRTPQGESGVCRNIDRCPSLLTLASQRPSQETLSLLNNLRCGFHGSVPIVCCTDGATESTPPPAQPPSPTPPPPPQPTPPPPSVTNPPYPFITDSPTPVQVDNTPPDVRGHPNLKLLPEAYCSPPGIDRIVNGNVTDVFAYPWIVRLGYRSSRGLPSEPVRYRCGGSLINSLYVLTAAHCIRTPGFYLTTVKLGEHTVDTPIDCRVNGACLPPPIDVDVEKTDVHPLYVSGVASPHDIALVRLARPIDFQREEFVRPVCLPVSPENQNLPLTAPLVAAGWGLTEKDVGSNELRHVLLPVIPNEQCRQIFRRPGLQTEIIPQQLCAGGVAGKNTCNGDSGGPLTFETDVGTESKAVLFGLVSFGHNNCTTEGVPGVATRVSFYVKWILDTITP